jgi:predicted nuclease of predicted toxin-antitoxin system
MKFLLDMPVSFLLLQVLQAYGHEGVHAYQIGKDRASDSELLKIARLESRVIITADLDFPRLLAHSLDELWAIEAERRVAEIEKGEVETVPGEEVFRKLHDRLKK